ncbi:MAG: methyl-accepting chemotaxis protein [Deltaproteobacteria bacterium]|nr:methyl-accepting chemotaxis protein [Deltaproteobacteria bacterium]
MLTTYLSKTIAMAIIFMVVMLAPAVYLTVQIKHLTDFVGQDALRANTQLELARQTQFHFDRMVQEWKNTLLRGYDPAMREKHHHAFQEEIGQVNTLLQKYHQEVPENDRELVASVQKEFQNLTEQYNQAYAVFAAKGGKDPRAADKIVQGKDRPVNGLLGAIITQANEQSTQSFPLVIQGVKQAQTVAYGGYGAGMLFLSVLTYFYIQSLLIPLYKTIGTIKEIAKGNLMTNVAIKQADEIGTLGMAVNSMTAELRTMFSEIKQNSLLLADQSGGLTQISGQMATTTMEISSQTNSMASATEEMSANINSMASSVEEMSVNIQSVSSGAKQMTENVNSVVGAVGEMRAGFLYISQSAQQAAQVSGKAKEMSVSASNTMNSLGSAAQEIGEVTAVIKRIAEQTNLLALNATIEAASAGDAGKGFAVVANEIKELANQSAGAAEDIAKKIGDIQNRTTQAVQAILDVSGIIETINDSVELITKSVNDQNRSAADISTIVEQTARVVSNVAVSINEVSKSTTDMARNAGEAARGSSEISNNIHGVNQGVNESSEGIQRISDSAKGLAMLAHELEKAVRRFHA